jgi:NAD+ kinase
MYPTVDALSITPICPHTLTNRPLIVPSDIAIRIVCRARDEEAYLTVDGQVGSPLERGDSVDCCIAGFDVLLIRTPEKTFFDVLRQKLKWGER